MQSYQDNVFLRINRFGVLIFFDADIALNNTPPDPRLFPISYAK